MKRPFINFAKMIPKYRPCTECGRRHDKYKDQFGRCRDCKKDLKPIQPIKTQEK